MTRYPPLCHSPLTASWYATSPAELQRAKVPSDLAPVALQASFPCTEDVTGKRAVQSALLSTADRPWLACEAVDTGEAVIVYCPPRRDKLHAKSWEQETDELEDLERKVKNLRRADQRAVRELRRYIVKNVLTRMWTLTYVEVVTDRAKVIRDVNDFLQRLRALVGEDIPSAYVIEPYDHGLHVHLALENRFIDWHEFGQTWGHGHVQFSDGMRSVRAQNGKRAQSRMLALYLCKYMSKAWADGHDSGDHRYEPAQGFRVQLSRRVFKTRAEARAWLCDRLGTPATEWWSGDSEAWEGPPVWAYSWDGP